MAQEVTTQRYSSAALAFLGDSVYEINIRSRIVRQSEGGVDELNKRSKALTNARAQARMIHILQDLLSAEELSVYKRGRNMKSLSAPKSCSISEYRSATGLEALMGYLFLENQQARIDELLEIGLREFTQE